MPSTQSSSGLRPSAGVSRRVVLRAGGAGVGLWFLGTVGGVPVAVEAAVADGLPGPVPSASIPKFATPLLIPPVMPRAATVTQRGGPNVDYYEVSLRQLSQQMLPPPWPATTVWGYGPTVRPRRGPAFHHAPSFTIEARAGRPVRVRWANELVDAEGNYLPHLLAVDPTLHWANPAGGPSGRDSRPGGWDQTPGPYTGPVPMVTHVHGAVGVHEDSDGYPEAWYLPAAANIPDGYATTGRWYDFFAGEAAARYGVEWGPGFAIQQYPNEDRASTNWYHDHTLGITRLNVYAGPAGFYVIRGGPDDVVIDDRTGTAAVLPGPAPREGDLFPPNKTYREIPLAIQDRSFDEDGQLWYPDSRAFFDGYEGPYIPGSDVSPIWNPEFFGNTLIVNGSVWPSHTVEQRRYRFRVLNGCQSRFLVLDFDGIPGVRVWVIGNEGGFIDGPALDLAGADNRLLLAPAERTDLVVDFTEVSVGSWTLRNVGPDEPFRGGTPGVDFEPADPEGAGTVMQFTVIPSTSPDASTPPAHLVLPSRTPVGDAAVVRHLALVERMSTVHDGPAAALLGVLDGDPNEDWAPFSGVEWMEPVTENPTAAVPEVWEFYNTTEDAHPIHVHEVAFEVLNRQPIEIEEEELAVRVATSVPAVVPEPWESGVKDVVIAYPRQVTRIRLRFDHDGTFVWHCHILEHEDNEMMRPLRVGRVRPGAPDDAPMEP